MYLKVLLLDNDKENIRKLSRTLGDSGFIPLFSQSNSEALSIIEHQKNEILALFFSKDNLAFIEQHQEALKKLAPQLKLFVIEETDSTFSTIKITDTKEQLSKKLNCPLAGTAENYLLEELENNKQRIANSHILLVEDDNINQMVVKHILEEANISVSIANHGQAAIDIIRATPHAFDLILMDIQMPILNGYEATKAIRQLSNISPKLPIIAMTGHTQTCEKKKCLESGMNDHIAKPINAQQMYSSIAKWVSYKT
ncbi:response regulator [Alteromonas sp. a30]|uniref:response regulator n=1 Tax=Alteromonas sp. a30 TaxID=2730917 RepID=UPI0022809ED0|nr:response regulator [Alteromonas sp. a30]MCY7295995.1 response regulator [Alteromonas sp. a30]